MRDEQSVTAHPLMGTKPQEQFGELAGPGECGEVPGVDLDPGTPGSGVSDQSTAAAMVRSMKAARRSPVQPRRTMSSS